MVQYKDLPILIREQEERKAAAGRAARLASNAAARQKAEAEAEARRKELERLRTYGTNKKAW